MKKVLAIILILPFISGCAMFQSGLETRVDSLDERVTVLEEHQGLSSDTSASETYVATTVEAAPAAAASNIHMSKKDIQRALKNAGYYYGPIDGKIGNKTKRAIREFQADKGLKVDGIVGSQTKKALSRYLNDIK